MSIHFDSEKRIFTLQTLHSTYQMQADRLDQLLHLYYGARTEGSIRSRLPPSCLSIISA